MKKRHFWIIIYILMTVFIFARSFKPATVSSGESRRIVIFLERIINFFVSTPPDNLRDVLTVFVRKMAHVAEFTVLSCVACRVLIVYGKALKDYLVWVLFSGLFTACVDEAIQLTTEGRAGMISDVFIDFSGTVLGIFISAFIICIVSKYKKKA